MTALRLFAALLLLLALQLLGCGDNGNLDDDDATGDDDDDDDDDATGDDDDDDDDDDSTPPPLAVVDVFPADQATDVPIGTSIWVEMSGPTEVELRLQNAAAVDVPGSDYALTATRQGFLPLPALAGGATYTATAVWATGSHEWTFTTVSGTDAPIALDPTGLTFSWSLQAGTLVSPPQAAQFLPQATQALLTQVASVDTVLQRIAFTGATADASGTAQDLCQPTVSIPQVPESSSYLDPLFWAGPADFAQTIAFDAAGQSFAVEVLLEGVVFTGRFAAASGAITSIEDGTLFFWFDGRNIDLGFGDTCSLLGFIPGFSCTACPDEPAAEQCVVVWVEGLSAPLVPDLDLQLRTQEAIDADAACD